MARARYNSGARVLRWKLRGRAAIALCCLGLWILQVKQAQAQLTLTGTSYSQNFDSIGTGLPTGWTARTGATSSSLGTSVTFTTTATSWGTNTGQFANYASNNIVSSSTSAIQGADTNRAFGVRQTDALGDPGGAFTLQIANTSGFTNFTMDFDLMTLSDQSRTTTYTIRYGLGSSPTTFTTLGTYTSGFFADTHETFGSAVLAGIADQSQNVWIQIIALTASAGSGSRDTVAIDDFSLTYSPIAVPEPSTWWSAVLALTAASCLQRKRLAKFFARTA